MAAPNTWLDRSSESSGTARGIWAGVASALSQGGSPPTDEGRSAGQRGGQRVPTGPHISHSESAIYSGDKTNFQQENQPTSLQQARKVSGHGSSSGLPPAGDVGGLPARAPSGEPHPTHQANPHHWNASSLGLGGGFASGTGQQAGPSIAPLGNPAPGSVSPTQSHNSQVRWY